MDAVAFVRRASRRRRGAGGWQRSGGQAGVGVSAVKPNAQVAVRTADRRADTAARDARATPTARTVILLAPAGYGKTTLARQWIERVGGAWVTVTSASGDIPVLARDLAAAVGAARELRHPARRDRTPGRDERPPTRRARSRGRSSGKSREPLDGWVVLDDYQFVVGNQRRRGAGRAARAEREVPVPRHLARATEVGDLAAAGPSRDRWSSGPPSSPLDEAEVAQLLPPDRRTAGLRRQARGWPAVIGLAAHAASRRRRPDRGLALGDSSTTTSQRSSSIAPARRFGDGSRRLRFCRRSSRRSSSMTSCTRAHGAACDCHRPCVRSRRSDRGSPARQRRFSLPS